MPGLEHELMMLVAAYIVAFALIRILLGIRAWRIIRQGLQSQSSEAREAPFSEQAPPVSVIVPAFNAEQTIVNSVRSMLQLRYPMHDVIVINDGSHDATLARLEEAFGLVAVPGAFPRLLNTEAVRGVYLSPAHPNLRVVDKDAGGKADAINAGLNLSVYPLFCCVDGDAVIDRDALLHLVQPFVFDPGPVACCGTAHLANGCEIRAGHLVKTALPSNALARLQIVEHLRAFLFGRMGWSAWNGLLITSGALVLLKKQAVIDCGGYLRETVNEGMELIVRMHRMLHQAGQSYRVSYAADSICWTEAPQTWRTLKNQRVRWYRGLYQSLWLNGSMLWRGTPNAAGWLAFPYFLLFECASPVVEILGYSLLAWMLVAGAVNGDAALLMLALALGIGVLLSSVALMLEEVSFHMYPRARDSLVLFGYSILENFGYRQINLLWQLQGMWQWLTSTRGGRSAARRGEAP